MMGQGPLEENFECWFQHTLSKDLCHIGAGMRAGDVRRQNDEVGEMSHDSSSFKSLQKLGQPATTACEITWLSHLQPGWGN